MTDFLQGWKQFLNENKQLGEATEEELSNLDDVLRNLNPQDLSFNNIFGDKMRIIEPMKTKDKDLERLKKLLNDSGYIPDFSTGLATYYEVTFPPKYKDGRPSKMVLTLQQTKDGSLVNHDRTRKKQIKIGKLLQKGSRLFDAAKKAQEDFENLKPEAFKISPDEAKPEDEVNIEKYKEASKKAEEKADTDFRKLTSTFFGTQPVMIDDTNNFAKLADWWNKKSAFYRENPEDAGETSSDYSIVYTRHPIDVMRMSDFDNIESCHSPPSRESSSGNSYYRCAVAEAHGHGPVAYVVRNEDLDELISNYDLEDASYQDLLDALDDDEGELFRDGERGVDGITPVSRQRIKKFVNPTLEISLAAPSTVTYGKRFPDLYSNISNFTKEKQEKELKKIEDSRGKEDSTFEGEDFNLGEWERFGGSYEDAGDYPKQVINKWLGYSVTGNPHYDSTTEDNLDVQGGAAAWENEVNDIRNRYNNRFQAANIFRAEVEDDGAGEHYIDIGAEFLVKIPEDKLVQSAFVDATRKAISWAGEYLKDDVGFSEFDGSAVYTAANGELIIKFSLDIESLNPEGSGYGYSPDNFEDIASNIDTLDDKADAITEQVEAYLKREGVMDGGALISLARALEDESWYEWSYEVDDDWAPTSIELETGTYVNFEDLTQKLPITLERANSDQSGEVYIMFAGDPLALASQASDGDGNFKWWEVRSPEFENDSLGGFKDLDEVKDYVRDQLTKLILRPKGSRIPKGLQSSRDYLMAVTTLMRDAAGGEEDEFAYPYRTMWVNGPDSDDEYKMMFGMQLDDDTSDDVVNNAHKIITETDDEDQLKEMFRTAFAQVAKIPGATINETKKHFSKFNLW